MRREGWREQTPSPILYGRSRPCNCIFCVPPAAPRSKNPGPAHMRVFRKTMRLGGPRSDLCARRIHFEEQHHACFPQTITFAVHSACCFSLSWCAWITGPCFSWSACAWPNFRWTFLGKLGEWGHFFSFSLRAMNAQKMFSSAIFFNLFVKLFKNMRWVSIYWLRLQTCSAEIRFISQIGDLNNKPKSLQLWMLFRNILHFKIYVYSKARFYSC